ncbi:MAG: hypothetical protein QM703_23300 [Gemmatales bacterium]
MSQSSRRWLIRLFVTSALLVVLCMFFVGYWNSTNLTPDNAFALMKDLATRHASDAEIVSYFGETEKLRSQKLKASVTDADYGRVWKFHQESFGLYDRLEISFVFDQQQNCITSVSFRDVLEGKRLWLFRWQRLLKSIGWQ